MLEVQGIGPRTFISLKAPGTEKQTEEVTVMIGVWGGGLLSSPMAIEMPLAQNW